MKQGICIGSVAGLIAGSAIAGISFFRMPHLERAEPSLIDSGSATAREVASLFAPSLRGPELFLHEVETLSSAGVMYFLDAAGSGDPTRVEAMLQHGTNVNAHDSDGRTALFCAATNGKLTMSQKLIAAGADVNAAENEGRTPLIAAAAAGEPAVMNALLEHGAQIEATDATGRTALHYAIAANRLPSVQLLLARGASCTHAATDGKDAIALACETGFPQIAKTILGAQPATLA